MTGKWKIGIAVSALLLSGCAKASTLPKKNEPLTLVVATDLHYLAPELHDQGERFQRLIEQSDGKLTEESEALVDQFVQEMLQKKPQAVLRSDFQRRKAQSSAAGAEAAGSDGSRYRRVGDSRQS